VIFDFDGVILDSETPEYEAHRRIYEACGVSLTPEEWCSQIGIWSETYEDRWFERLSEQAASHPFDRSSFRAEKSRLFQEVVPGEPMRGIRELVEPLATAAVPLAVASSSPARWVVPALERLGLRGHFHAIVTGDEVANRKPSPDSYLEAARRVGAEPSRVIAIEDSGPGIAAARAAGMKAVVIPHWLTETHDLSGADLRVSHAGELTLSLLESLCARTR